MSLMIYIPDAPAAPETVLVKLGLGGVMPPGTGHGSSVAGPGGTTGSLVGPPRGLRYDAEAQTWYPGPEKSYWIGWPTDSPPSPKELLRPKFVSGQVLRLGDGNDWICPTARLYDGTPKLPVRFGLDVDGNDAGEIVAEYADLWALAQQVWVGALAEMQDPDSDEPVLSPDRVIEIAHAALAANYRVNGTVVKALGLLTTENIHEITRTLVDFETFRAILQDSIEKKKDVA